ncbi:hypothetical protein EKD04_017960 [Chloroflexales bacterium ZM16-3]|nr:hypothetical protein [Chloroflexales bacterium ZM16-3]
MCLQWCHVWGWLIDNDISCWDCPAYGLPPVASCASCAHRRAGAGGPMCSLTKAALPYVGGCCHHNADLGGVGSARALDALPVAPWLLAAHRAATAEALVASHHSAPDLERRDGRTWLQLDDLAVPLVYGVTADAWGSAVALPLAEPIPDAPPHVAAAMEVLEALASGGNPRPAYAQLVALLDVTPLDALPAYWRSTVGETLALANEAAGWGAQTTDEGDDDTPCDH